MLALISLQLMGDFERDLYFLVIPMIAANVLHMFVVKKNLFRAWAKPIASKQLGVNKTWRAFIVLPLFTGFFTWLSGSFFKPYELSSFELWFLGLGLGFCYLLFELPNSFLKRRMGIPSGQRSRSYPQLQLLVDKSDSLIGILLFYGWYFSLGLSHLLSLFLVSLLLHYSISYLLVLLKIKEAL